MAQIQFLMVTVWTHLTVVNQDSWSKLTNMFCSELSLNLRFVHRHVCVTLKDILLIHENNAVYFFLSFFRFFLSFFFYLILSTQSNCIKLTFVFTCVLRLKSEKNGSGLRFPLQETLCTCLLAAQTAFLYYCNVFLTQLSKRIPNRVHRNPSWFAIDNLTQGVCF